MLGSGGNFQENKLLRMRLVICSVLQHLWTAEGVANSYNQLAAYVIIVEPQTLLPRALFSCFQLLTQLEIASGMKHFHQEYQAMHEREAHVPACLGRGMAKLKAVMWRDLVEVTLILGN